MNVRFVTGLLAGGLVALAAAGCGGAHTTAAPGRDVVSVVERDFQITLPRDVAAGLLTFAVDNKGPDQHELIVVRLSKTPLPLRRDGITIDEAKLGAAEVGSLEPGPPGSLRDLRLRLAPGRYRLFCNMYGHYMSGMSADLLVR